MGWDMLASHRLLMELQAPEVADAFERTLLGLLDDHDARRGTDLVRTVEVFLDQGGHWKPAAELLHVHVNTLRHRLDRVAALTGRDLADGRPRRLLPRAAGPPRAPGAAALSARGLGGSPHRGGEVGAFGQWAHRRGSD